MPCFQIIPPGLDPKVLLMSSNQLKDGAIPVLGCWWMSQVVDALDLREDILHHWYEFLQHSVHSCSTVREFFRHPQCSDVQAFPWESRRPLYAELLPLHSGNHSGRRCSFLPNPSIWRHLPEACFPSASSFPVTDSGCVQRGLQTASVRFSTAPGTPLHVYLKLDYLPSVFGAIL